MTYLAVVEESFSVRVALKPVGAVQVVPDSVNFGVMPVGPSKVAVVPLTLRPKSTWLSEDDQPPPNEPDAVESPL